MAEKPDWRLTNQQKYLSQAKLKWARYVPPRESWDHDHCEFRWAKFMASDDPDSVQKGFVTEDDYRWICKTCYEDFKDMFQWELLE